MVFLVWGLDCREPVTGTRRDLILVFCGYEIRFSWPGLIRVMRLTCYDATTNRKWPNSVLDGTTFAKAGGWAGRSPLHLQTQLQGDRRFITS